MNKKTEVIGQPKIVKTVCNMCTNHCGLNAYVEDGKIVRIEGAQEHPFHNLCVKPYAIPEWVHSSERLTNPLKKENGKFKEISWDEAFDFIADRLIRIRKEYGTEAVVTHLGGPLCIGPMIKTVLRRFSDLYGTPNYTSGAFVCFLARVIGSVLTCGAFPNPDLCFTGTGCILVWGKNPPESFASERDAINSNIGRGANLIVVDPRKTSLAKKADIYAQIRPGTDCALALGLLNIMIAEKLYDSDFVKTWTVGFDKLVKHVKEFTPQRVEEITWVPAETVKAMARMYATTKPACMDLGISLEHQSSGVQTIRALTVLEAITGNLDIQGGNLVLPGLAYTNLRLPDKITQKVTVGDGYPIYSKYVGEPSGTTVTENILSGKPYPISALLISSGNPYVMWPNSNQVEKALKKLDFLLVHDIFMTESAKMADIVLPGTTFLETDELRDIYFSHEGIALASMSQKVIEPIGNAMEDWKIWAKLGRRMGYKNYFPWKDSDELINELLKPTNITLEQLRQNPGGIYYSEREFQKYLKAGFNTPSGKVEIFSEELYEHGYEPLPTFHEPIESPIIFPDRAKDYPLILTTGARTEIYTHARYRNVPSLRKRYPEPLVEINSKTAKGLGIADGDMVTVESLRGSIRARAKLTEDIHQKVVSMLHGWSNLSGANVNRLTDNKAVDPISSFPEFRSLLCRVAKE